MRLELAARLACVCAAAIATEALAAPAFGAGFREIPPSAWVLTFVLSTLAGLLALLNRIRDELRSNGELRWMGLFCASHMLGSWVAGLLGFLLALSASLGEAATAVSILTTSFGGSVLIEKLAIKWLWKNLGVDVSKPGALGPPIERTFDAAATTTPSPSVLRPPERRRKRKESSGGAQLEAVPDPRRSSDFTPLEDSDG